MNIEIKVQSDDKRISNKATVTKAMLLNLIENHPEQLKTFIRNMGKSVTPENLYGYKINRSHVESY